MNKINIPILCLFLLSSCSIGEVDGRTAEEWKNLYDDEQYNNSICSREKDDLQNELDDLQYECDDIQSELDDIQGCVEDYPYDAANQCM